MTLAAGSRLGPYEILAPLGAGGMGEVYRARDMRLAREVAIKVLPAGLASDASRLKRFEKEARSASALNHPNIVTIYDIGSESGVSYIAMERVEGETLRKLLVGGALPVKKLLAAGTQIADGLARAHEAGIVHRDLKPENVMVTKDGLVKILDFGLAKLTRVESGEGESHLPTMTGTSPGMVVGTAGYMSPEQASGEQVDFRSDQFSLGSILYEMATGKRAFLKQTGAEILSAIIREEPEPVSSINPVVPPPLRWLIERCLAKDADERYGTTRDLAKELSTVRDRLPETIGSGSSPAAAVGWRRRRAVFLANLGLLMGLAAAIVLLAGRHQKSAPVPRFQRLTFHRAFYGAARFAPGGTVVYNDSNELFTTIPGSIESRRLGIEGFVLSVSALGELAVDHGVLATAPLGGGALRDLVSHARSADWAPDGKSLAIIRRSEGKYRLELPIGHVLYESVNLIDNLHVSPDGGRIAFREIFGQLIHAKADVVFLDLKSLKTERLGVDSSEFGWARGGKELWFLENLHTLWAVDSARRRRLIARFPGEFQLDDVAPDGRLLLERIENRGEIRCQASTDKEDRSLSWLNSSFAADLSSDGKTLLLNEQLHDTVYSRKTDGSPAVALGKGRGLSLSPDGALALVLRAGPPPELVLMPTGAGDERVLKTPGFESFVGGSFLPDGKSILFCGTERDHKPRLFVMGVGEGGTPRAISPEGVELGGAPVRYVSPDGKLAFAFGEGSVRLYPLEEGVAPVALPITGLNGDEMPVGWTSDSRSLFVQSSGEDSFSVAILDWQSGKHTPFRDFKLPDPVGASMSTVLVTPNGKNWVHSYWRRTSDIYLVDWTE